MPFYANRKEPEIIGAVYHGREKTEPQMIEIGMLLARSSMDGDLAKRNSKRLSNGSYQINSMESKRQLSDRQMEVLFYSLRGYPHKLIARSLDLSVRTVDDHVRRLQRKFEVNNHNDLVWKALDEGYHDVIPSHFIENKQCSRIIREVLPHRFGQVFSIRQPSLPS